MIRVRFYVRRHDNECVPAGGSLRSGLDGQGRPRIEGGARDALGEAGMVEWSGGQLVKERAPAGMPGIAVPVLQYFSQALHSVAHFDGVSPLLIGV